MKPIFLVIFRAYVIRIDSFRLGTIRNPNVGRWSKNLMRKKHDPLRTLSKKRTVLFILCFIHIVLYSLPNSDISYHSSTFNSRLQLKCSDRAIWVYWEKSLALKSLNSSNFIKSSTFKTFKALTITFHLNISFFGVFESEHLWIPPSPIISVYHACKY